MIDEIPAALLRLKTLIWVHSALGALLVLGLPIATVVTHHGEFASAVLPCLAVWGLGYRSLQTKASDLAPEERVPMNILPLWVPPLVAVGSFLCPLWFMTPFGAPVLGAWVLLAATIALQWGISTSLGVPVHRRAWSGMLFALCLPFLLALLFGLLFLIAMAF